MKRWIGSLAIISLVVLGSIVIYKEALAITPLCDDLAENCGHCGGNFIVDSCWQYNGLNYCQVRCEACPHPYWRPNCNCICASAICIL